jgi:hypothetical protein
MTSAPVPLAEQIAWAQRDVRKLEVFASGRGAVAYEHDLACARAVLATLQQHERARKEAQDAIAYS